MEFKVICNKKQIDDIFCYLNVKIKWVKSPTRAFSISEGSIERVDEEYIYVDVYAEDGEWVKIKFEEIHSIEIC